MRRTGLFVLICALSAFAVAQERMIPHLTAADGGFASTLYLENTSAQPRTWTLTPYDRDGNALPAVEGTLEGRAQFSQAAATLVGETAAHLVITGEDISATVAYVAEAGGGSPAHVAETNEQATRHRFFAGDWNAIFDGVAVVNTGTEAADVWIAQINAEGTVVQSARVAAALAPRAKALYVLGSPDGSAFDAAAGSLYEVYATVPLAMTALRGNLPGSDYLWANPTRVGGTAQSSRDSEGVWHIENGNLYDVVEMMGYNIATDRLWQLETFRRLALGTLSEVPLVSNAGTLEQDRFARTTGYSMEELQQGVAELAPEARAAVRGYVDGVNRRRAEALADPDLLPVEFKAVGIQPEPWLETDVLAVLVTLLRSFDPQDFGSGQLQNAALLQQLEQQFPDQAATMFADLRPLNDPDAPTMIPAGPGAKTAGTASSEPATQEPGRLRTDINFAALHYDFETRFALREQIQRELNAKMKMGSYAWVVAAEHTQSGNPILYSGPQMGFMTPSIVVEGSVRGGGIHISGATVPGIPGIIVGRTPHHAWSMQVGHADTMDLYIEPELGEVHRTETIRGAFGEETQLDVYRSNHGPLINTDPPTAWRYAHWGYEFDTIQAFYDLAKAESMDSFGEALTRIGVSQHFCYADRDGNIAYWMSGRAPVRPEGEYRFPQGAVAGAPILEYDLETVHPLVHDRNTAQGYYGGWNNKSRADVANSNVDNDRYYGPFHRALVVDNHLRDLVNAGNITFEDVRDMALAVASTERHLAPSRAIPFTASTPLGNGSGGGNPWPLLRDGFTAAVAANPSEARNAAVALLDNWDGYFVDGGPSNHVAGADRADAWMLMDAWVRSVLTRTFEEIAGIGSGDHINTFIRGLDSGTTLTNQYDWFTNADASAPQTRAAVIVAALDDALAALGEQPWGTGLRGTINFEHPMLSLLTGRPLHSMPFSNRSTYAQCVEVGETGPVRIESMFPLGESGNAFGEGFTFELDTHVLTMTPFYDDFSHRPFPLFTENE
ncbi:penicillin acylase family protein [Acanthopleuribacter pedis]|uniref:Penicillin acylase family protein n=1 Tax=Acanthopleuribacter pedis TaxID=442870 RepID=A0A8J7Q3J0_9BACT|nr:penicillin acylase family protein [Acanthopleuribacter pedis]MBO1319897.1 penicillin acylase family protein [Acanthopleuribacter pedis]